jgi:acetyl-CoA acetyltransferase family protein
MRFSRACIPLGYAWSSPFSRWQGALADLNSVDLAVLVTGRALAERDLPAEAISQLVLGWTVPQKEIFYGATTVAARLGASGVTGPMIGQACATSVACVQAAATAVDAGEELALVVTTDRTSNGPHLVYPSPSGPGGMPETEDWVMDNFNRDPWAGRPMIGTAEQVAAQEGITRQECDAVTLLRHEQYQAALAEDREFQRGWMVPVELPRRRGDPVVVDADVGVFPTTAEGLAKLAPLDPQGVVTYGSQTHPADGTAGLVVTSEGRARELGRGGVVRLLGSGMARVGKAEMAKAPVPAAQAALHAAGQGFTVLHAVVTHNPFAVNDVYFTRQTGFPLERMNAYGCSLVYGHPQGPTGARGITELIHTLVRRGGGIGLFTGCAAGDTGAAVVLRVDG